jgi:hypothetical protein
MWVAGTSECEKIRNRKNTPPDNIAFAETLNTQFRRNDFIFKLITTLLLVFMVTSWFPRCFFSSPLRINITVGDIFQT